MTVQATSLYQNDIDPTHSIPLTASKRFEWLYILFSFWFLAGIYWDAWAHTHIPDQESFFSPYHLLMYSGASALSGLILFTIFFNYGRTGLISTAIPLGYSAALAGVVIFMSGGIGDMIWHILFGIEQGLEASFSPTHILLMLGIQLFLVAPLYASWLKGTRASDGYGKLSPTVLSFGFLLSGIMVISQWAHPFVVTYATLPRNFGNEAVGILSFFVQTVFLMGLVLLTIKEELLPVGSYTIALTINAIFLTLMRSNFEFIPIAIVTGLLIDLIVFQLSDIRNKIRLIAILVPLIYFGLYFIVLAIFNTITWSIHLIAGSVVIAMVVSLLIGIFVYPPKRPSRVE